ncbi:tetratricopeptide repeat protein [Streptomyces broussonetiae]|uniref:tetratricopeptide repeat protein n=1 Tax=Streptomyces broussonetiae TaxID=2686304 RepID=UPI0035D6D567
MAFDRSSWEGPRPDPGLEQAAEFGDSRAMMRLGYFFEECDLQQAQRWFQGAAEAGESHAMYRLAKLLEGREAEQARHWYRRAAEAGDLPAMYAMVRSCDDVEEGFGWLRQAAEHGHVDARLEFGRALRDRGLSHEAEHWLRTAAEGRDERWIEPRDLAEIDAGLGPRHQACLDLVTLLTAQGRFDEASQVRDAAEYVLQEESALGRPYLRRSATGTIVETAVVTTAVIPFVQALMSKVAEDAYGQARALVQRMLHRSSPQTEASNGATLLIADDPDAHISLCLWSDVPDEALRALASLDLNELTAQRPDRGRIRLVWNTANSKWQIRGDLRDE